MNASIKTSTNRWAALAPKTPKKSKPKESEQASGFDKEWNSVKNAMLYYKVDEETALAIVRSVNDQNQLTANTPSQGTASTPSRWLQAAQKGVSGLTPQ